jgi:hypothetical protein
MKKTGSPANPCVYTKIETSFCPHLANHKNQRKNKRKEQPNKRQISDRNTCIYM